MHNLKVGVKRRKEEGFCMWPNMLSPSSGATQPRVFIAQQKIVEAKNDEKVISNTKKFLSTVKMALLPGDLFSMII